MSSPPVTIVLICYNQERFIEAAIKAALQQNYPAIKLIVSDDCSSDGTYETALRVIEQEGASDRASTYRADRNMGLTANFAFACSKADTALIVIAAGDDISKPERVSELYNAWTASRADIISSSYDVIDDEGQSLPYDADYVKGNFNSGPLFYQPLQHFYAGATAAYSKRLIHDFVNAGVYEGSEDAALLYYAMHKGYVIQHLPQALVLYRRHAGSMSQAVQHTVILQETFSQNHAQRLLGSLLFLKNLVKRDETIGTVNKRLLNKTIKHYRFRMSWITSSLTQRFGALFGAPDAASVRWLLPRVLGIGVFAAIKSRLRR